MPDERKYGEPGLDAALLREFVWHADRRELTDKEVLDLFVRSTPRLLDHIAELQAEVERLRKEREDHHNCMEALVRSTRELRDSLAERDRLRRELTRIAHEPMSNDPNHKDMDWAALHDDLVRIARDALNQEPAQ